MATFCYRCPRCSYTHELPFRTGVLPCVICINAGRTSTMVRDYKAEAVGMGSGVRVSKMGTLRDQARMVLPTREDFKGPGDPDGYKGLREWNDTHQPAEGNSNPVRPEN